MNRFTILLLFFSTLTFGQENTVGVRPGIQVSSVFSDHYDHGISPALTLSAPGWMLSIGPRFTYDRMLFREKSQTVKRDQQLIMDASFRYYPFREWEKVRPFALGGITYKYTRFVYEQEFGDGLMATYGPTYDYAFRGSWNNEGHTVNVFVGLGVDISIWKQLSAFASAGAGTSLFQAKSVLTNTGTGAVEYSEKSRQNGQFRWIASIGLGYRF